MDRVQRIISGSMLVLLIGSLSAVAYGAERPDWAFPTADNVQPPTKEDDQPKTLPGSSKSYTQHQIDDLKNPPDWFPDTHPPMPDVVARGTVTFACGSCHLPIGTGHDESAYLAALPESYLVSQMADFKIGVRKGFGIMPAIAQALGDAESRSAVAYFASLPARPWVHVVEFDIVPKTYVNASNMRLALQNGGSEPLGNRIVELPDDETAAIARDPRSGFVAYVPKGSVSKGESSCQNGQQQNDGLHHLSRSGAQGCRYSTVDRRPAYRIRCSPALFLPGRQPFRWHRRANELCRSAT